MREVEDGLDILISVVAMIMMLSVCIWSLAMIKSGTEIAVDEKSAVHNVFGQSAQQPIMTARDALMSLVVNDPYVPNPITVVFKMGSESYTVTFNNAYFKDKEDSINKAWEEFFHDKMNATIASTTLDASGTRWIVRLVP